MGGLKFQVKSKKFSFLCLKIMKNFQKEIFNHVLRQLKKVIKVESGRRNTKKNVNHRANQGLRRRLSNLEGKKKKEMSEKREKHYTKKVTDTVKSESMTS